jgi:hypothetical protein
MDTLIEVILLMGVAFAAAAVGWWAAGLRARQNDLVKRLEQLEQMAPKRHIHKNAVNIENVLANAIRARRDMAEAMAASETLLDILKAWRSDPNYKHEND